jgi:ATP citrate (pro-S)-lyase
MKKKKRKKKKKNGNKTKQKNLTYTRTPNKENKMASRAIREFDGKRILASHLVAHAASPADATLLKEATTANDNVPRILQVTGNILDFNALATSAPWVSTTKLVAKPDQLIKRRGKGGLLLLNADWKDVSTWISSKNRTDISVDGVNGVLDTFLVEPFVPHKSTDEYYVCIASNRFGEEILFTHEGGVDVGDVDAKAKKLMVPIGTSPSAQSIVDTLLGAVPEERRPVLTAFISALMRLYSAANFTYLEINPLVVVDSPIPGHCPRLYALDMAAKLDEAANFLSAPLWGDIHFPPAFGRAPTPEEAYIRELDGKTGASLKLTILNSMGRVWTMVAGGGASVVYAGMSNFGKKYTIL